MVSIVFSVFSFIIIVSVVEQISPDNKIFLTLKPAIFCAVIISVLSLISDIKISVSDIFSISEQKVNDVQSVWQCAKDNCEKLLEDKFKDLCIKNSIDIENVDVSILSEAETFKISKVEIDGIDNVDAKNLISSYYSIPSEYIYISGG